MFYPILKIPNIVARYFRGDFPELKEQTAPEEPIKGSFNYVSYLVVVSLALIFLVITSIIFKVVFLICIVVAVIIGVSDFKTFQSAYTDKVLIYKQRVNEYNRHLAEQQIIRNRIENPAFRSTFIRQNVSRFLASSPSISFCELSFAQIGRSESYFLHFLQNEFGEKIFSGLSIYDDHMNHPYTPDFIYCDGRIAIDIEIDEPYDFRTKKATHFCSEDNMTHSDDSRDGYFLEKNWVVMRFSEKQIYTQPKQCVELIKCIIESLCIDIDGMYSLGALIKDECWTNQQALHYAEVNYRSSYYKVGYQPSRSSPNALFDFNYKVCLQDLINGTVMHPDNIKTTGETI
jgi:very-short-patch-repair endonuclease